VASLSLASATLNSCAILMAATKFAEVLSQTLLPSESGVQSFSLVFPSNGPTTLVNAPAVTAIRELTCFSVLCFEK